MSSKCICFKTYVCLWCEGQAERALAIAEGKRIPRKVAQCGTRAGYKRHLDNGEPTCQPCKDAQKAGVQAWQRSKLSA